VVSHPPEAVFNAINNVRGWWSKDSEGNTNELNGDFIVRFGDTRKNLRLIESEQNKKITWLVTDCFLPWNRNITEWTGTKICFEIFVKSNKTHIQFTHIGFGPEADCYERCSKAWDIYLEGSLMNLITKGIGQPTPANTVRSYHQVITRDKQAID
jgi:hypothetical protein